MAQKKITISLDSIPSKNIIKDLEKGDVCQKKLILSEEVLYIKDKLIGKLEYEKSLLQLGSTKLRKALDEKEEAIRLQYDIINNDEKIISKANKKINFWKISTLVVTGMLGYSLLK